MNIYDMVLKCGQRECTIISFHNLCLFQRSTDFTYKLALDVRKKKLGSLTPGVSLLHPVEDFLKELMPDDAYKLATDRLYISLTKRQGKKNVVVSKYESNEHLMQVECFAR